MISFNCESALGGRNSTNDYINKIGVKNNVVLSQELYKNKLFMRRNNDFGKDVGSDITIIRGVI